jgi:hypothetical protein
MLAQPASAFFFYYEVSSPACLLLVQREVGPLAGPAALTRLANLATLTRLLDPAAPVVRRPRCDAAPCSDSQDLLHLHVVQHQETDSVQFPFSLTVTAKWRKVWPQFKPKRSGESQILRYIRILSRFQLQISWRRISCSSMNHWAIKGSTHHPHCKFSCSKPKHRLIAVAALLQCPRGQSTLRRASGGHHNLVLLHLYASQPPLWAAVATESLRCCAAAARRPPVALPSENHLVRIPVPTAPIRASPILFSCIRAPP